MQGELPSQQVTVKTPQWDQDDEGGLELGRFVEALRRYLWLIGGLSVLMGSAAYLVALREDTVYQASFEILTEPVTVENQVISSLSGSLTNRQGPESFTLDETKIKLLRSPEVLGPVAENLQEKYANFNYDKLKKNLNIKTSSANILEVTFQHSNADLVKDVLEGVSQAYLRYSLEERQTDVRQGLDFVEDQLPRLEGRVEDLQENLQDLRQQYNLVDPETTGAQLSNSITTIKEQKLTTEVELDELQSVYRALQAELASSPPELAASSVLKESGRYQELLNQLQSLDSEMAKQSALYLEESPELKLLREQRERLIPLLRREGEQVMAELQAQIRALEDRDRALSEQLANLNEQVKQLSVVNREYTEIERRLTIATENLNQFLVKKEALGIDAAQREVPWRLLEDIGEPKPSVASTKQNLLLGAVLGFMLGCGAALALDKLGNILYTAKEVKQTAKLPLLGIIPLQSYLDESSPASDWLKPTPEQNGQSSQDAFSLSGAVSGQRLELELESGPGVSLWERVKPLLQKLPIPFLKSAISTSSPQHNTRLFLEAFRSLSANLRLLVSDHPLRSLVITSATPSEGKSTVAAYLAQASATMDRRVLIVDMDLRRPQVHQRMGVNNWVGLTDIVTADKSSEDVIQRSPFEANLYILSTGPIPPDPIRLLASQKMHSLMQHLHQTFDLVIYDAPPLMGLADAQLIAANTNGMVLVAGLGNVKRVVLEQALYDLRVSGLPILGAVANLAKETSSTPSQYTRDYDAQANPTVVETGGGKFLTSENFPQTPETHHSSQPSTHSQVSVSPPQSPNILGFVAPTSPPDVAPTPESASEQEATTFQSFPSAEGSVEQNGQSQESPLRNDESLAGGMNRKNTESGQKINPSHPDFGEKHLFGLSVPSLNTPKKAQNEDQTQYPLLAQLEADLKRLGFS
ncbi:polysaccharide biosynthesis tyrosine autokinase [Spirulina sp. CS-785/01]|uniref:GumC family protein n=1 Tax=Spirulina sp. CS-785/01 TaxID=3021716 RepID=UPI002330B945|nr:polysaccharide biosynthesis tyrosine autokinase [Spirulina sp. CS-785/01]MDB9315530.1 polysaccharide biosynthesis tyrosine autokinase [Spirulina sp. CS-785/01]